MTYIRASRGVSAGSYILRSNSGPELDNDSTNTITIKNTSGPPLTHEQMMKAVKQMTIQQSPPSQLMLPLDQLEIMDSLKKVQEEPQQSESIKKVVIDDEEGDWDLL